MGAFPSTIHFTGLNTPVGIEASARINITLKTRAQAHGWRVPAWALAASHHQA